MAKTFTPGTAAWLSSLGHPGYSAAFARRVWVAMQAEGLSAHEAIYGRRPDWD